MSEVIVIGTKKYTVNPEMLAGVEALLASQSEVRVLEVQETNTVTEAVGERLWKDKGYHALFMAHVEKIPLQVKVPGIGLVLIEVGINEDCEPGVVTMSNEEYDEKAPELMGGCLVYLTDSWCYDEIANSIACVNAKFKKELEKARKEVAVKQTNVFNHIRAEVVCFLDGQECMTDIDSLVDIIYGDTWMNMY